MRTTRKDNDSLKYMGFGFLCFMYIIKGALCLLGVVALAKYLSQ